MPLIEDERIDGKVSRKASVKIANKVANINICDSPLNKMDYAIKLFKTLHDRLIEPTWEEEYTYSNMLYNDLLDKLESIKELIYRRVKSEQEQYANIIIDLLINNINYIIENEVIVRVDIYRLISSSIYSTANVIKMIDVLQQYNWHITP